MSNTIRTFIAIDIHPAIQKIVLQAQNHLKKCDCNIKWTNPTNIHLTLKFLGDVNLKKIDDVIKVLSELASSSKPFETEITNVGAFPTVSRPHILWIGLKDGQQHIIHLTKSLENKLGNIGFKKETKPFRPHITIGRIRTPRNLNILSQCISDYDLPKKASQAIQDIVLYKSTLTSTGPIYEKLNVFHLGKA